MLLGSAIAMAVAVGNTGHSSETPIDPTKPAWVYHPPRTLKLTARDRNALLEISTKFIRTAVARKELDASWALVAPELRNGESRVEWDSGNIPVVPYPSKGIAAWDVLYSYPDDVAFDIALIGDTKKQAYISKTFTIELKRYHRPNGSHWLVASWTPRGVSSYASLKPSARPAAPPPVKAQLSRWFLIVPAAIFGGMLSSLLLWGLVAYLRARRAARRYAQLLGQTSSSSPS